jgi:predicted DNA-binding ribbon-helix-helix protein
MPSTLKSRNVSVGSRRTSLKLEPEFWDTILDICRRECCTPHDLCSVAEDRRSPHETLTSALRLLVLDYFRESSTEDGHMKAGHGQCRYAIADRQRLEERDRYVKNLRL